MELEGAPIEGTEDPSIEAEGQEQPSWAEDKFVVGGKEIKANRDQILKWAQMGYNYPQKAQELNLKEQKWQQELNQYKSQAEKWKDVEQKWAPYKEVDEYAAKNPDWWQQVQQSYQEKMQGAQTNPELQQLKSELQELKQFRDQLAQEKQNQKVQEEDSQLSQEVESIRKQFPNLDFATPDEEGKSLEMKVLEHADKIGATSFRVAFRDFYHDHLINKAKEEGKETVSKELQKQTKLGILGTSSKPTKLQVAKIPKDYNEAADMALADLRAMKKTN